MDLNKVCPKDSYSLLNINQLVDGSLGCNLLSFMDAYFDYNHIRMHPQDEAKTRSSQTREHYVTRYHILAVDG
ncbi:hypothetical protein CR513_33409, partial [Mucuna pruriens]